MRDSFTLALIAASIVTCWSAVAGAQPLRAVVVVYNDARIPSTILDPAKNVSTSLFSQAGIELEWFQGSEITGNIAAYPRLRIRIVSKANQGAMQFPSRPLGFIASKHSGLAYILEHQVIEVARGYGIPESIVLATAISHELGHLLLPATNHTPTGLMRNPFRQVDLIDMRHNRLRFTPAQAAQLRAAVISLRRQLLVSK